MKKQSLLLTSALVFSLCVPVVAGGLPGEISVGGKIQSINAQSRTFVLMTNEIRQVKLKHPQAQTILTSTATEIHSQANVPFKFEDLTTGMSVWAFGTGNAIEKGKPLTASSITMAGSGKLDIAPLLGSNFDAYEKVLGPAKDTDSFPEWDAQNRYYKFPGVLRVILHRQGTMRTLADLWDRVSWIKVQFRPGEVTDWKEALRRVGFSADQAQVNGSFITGFKPAWNARWTPNEKYSKTDELEIDKDFFPMFIGPNNQRPQQTVLAHFSFNGTNEDVREGKPKFGLRNTTFQENALSLNGKYDFGGPGGYRTCCDTPDLDYTSFSVALRVKPTAFGSSQTNIITGGFGYRWFGLERSDAGNIIVMMNGGKFRSEIMGAEIPAGKWTLVACGVDLAKRKVLVYLNGKEVGNIDLPEDFKLAVTTSPTKDSDKNWSFANYGAGNVFYGLVDELIVYGKMLSPAEFQQLPDFSSNR